MRSRHLAQSIERHLEYLFHLFAYLGKYQNAEMLYDPIVPCITSAAFQKQDWTYSTITMTEKDMKEVLPPDMPEPRGKGFVICCSTDAYELVIRSRGNLVLVLC